MGGSGTREWGRVGLAQGGSCTQVLFDLGLVVECSVRLGPGAPAALASSGPVILAPSSCMLFLLHALPPGSLPCLAVMPAEQSALPCIWCCEPRMWEGVLSPLSAAPLCRTRCVACTLPGMRLLYLCPGLPHPLSTKALLCPLPPLTWPCSGLPHTLTQPLLCCPPPPHPGAGCAVLCGGHAAVVSASPVI